MVRYLVLHIVPDSQSKKLYVYDIPHKSLDLGWSVSGEDGNAQISNQVIQEFLHREWLCNIWY
jgi:hypothetical protein